MAVVCFAVPTYVFVCHDLAMTLTRSETCDSSRRFVPRILRNGNAGLSMGKISMPLAFCLCERKMDPAQFSLQRAHLGVKPLRGFLVGL